ncbi:MAG: ABC transporter ATP-binding protein [Clostridia bacterium]
MQTKNLKEKDPSLNYKKTFGRLLKFIIMYYKKEVIVVGFSIIISSISSIVAVIFLQKLIDNCIIPGVNAGLASVWKQLITYILLMGGIFVLGVIASFIYTRIMAVVTQGTLNNLRENMFSKMESFPIKYFDTHKHGDIMSTYTNDTDAIRQFIGQSLPTLIQAIITITATMFMMIFYSLWLTLLVVIACIILFVIIKKISAKSSKYMVRQQKSLAKEEGFVEEMMNGQKVIKAFCHQKESNKDFAELNEQLFEDGQKANKYGNILMPIVMNIGNILYVLIAIVGGFWVFFDIMNVSLTGINIISIGVIVSFLTMSRQLSQTIGQTSMQLPMIAMGFAGASRVFELLDEEPEKDNGYVTLVKANIDNEGNITESAEYTGLWAWKHPHKIDNSITYEQLKGDIRMFDVDFCYEPEKMVLHNVTLYANPGQKIAFVGATGAGKTTITNLINRFYDIEDGKIRYDGININKIRKPDLRRSLAIVLQDVNLFTGTVLENIRYGKLDATDEECIEAAKLANADDFITRLPDGYNSLLDNNGSNLSQGQRQLLSIARAAVANAPAMILDEATSSIDTHTEALVQDGMDKLMKGRTVFVIAHRLSTVRNSDAIIVLDHGKIIEKGNHEQLLEQKGTYYQLYTGAFELE